jgi:hypothetical protein
MKIIEQGGSGSRTTAKTTIDKLLEINFLAFLPRHWFDVRKSSATRGFLIKKIVELLLG